MREQKKKNNGFTLVELIVVLVILAILAAILVPALLGYIDRAKKQQIVLNAKNCLTAAQAEWSSLYGKGQEGIIEGNSGYVGSHTVIADTPEAERILNTADVPDCTYLVIGCDTAMTQDSKAGYKITFVYYAEGDKAVYFDGKKWVDTEEYPTSVASGKTVYYVKLDREY